MGREGGRKELEADGKDLDPFKLSLLIPVDTLRLLKRRRLLGVLSFDAGWTEMLDQTFASSEESFSHKQDKPACHPRDA